MGERVPTADLPSGLVPAKDLPATAIPEPVAASQADVRRVDESIAKAAPKRSRWGSGDVGSLLSAGQALGALDRFTERTAYTGGGAVTDVASKAFSPETAAALGFGANVAIQAVPTVLGGEATKVAAPAVRSWGRQLMQSALKPSKAEHATGKAAAAVTTMLEEGANVTPGGLDKLRGEIDKLNDAIKQAIERSGATVDKAQVAKTLDQLTERVKMQVTPQADMATVQKALQEFLEHPLLAQVSDIPVQLAQQLKQGTYRSLGSKAYGELKGADVEAQKALARGLKEGVAGAVPEVGPLNAAESKLLNAANIAGNRVLMDANKNPMGLGWLAAHPSTWLGFAADRSPLVKSLLARALHSGAEPITRVPGQVFPGAATGLVSAQPPRKTE